MLFNKKLKRVIDVEKAEEEFEERTKDVEFEKDGLAMTIAALLVFIPALLLVLGIFVLAIWFFFWKVSINIEHSVWGEYNEHIWKIGTEEKE